ncbi:MAG: hypothetical protein GY697_11100 [Desulfobacterales bacterium]|nr:hypothetical protein [Desulfobacterales bacterium]
MKTKLIVKYKMSEVHYENKTYEIINLGIHYDYKTYYKNTNLGILHE